MPELVMHEILKYFDFREVQHLRKVCHDLRNFIDDNKKDAKISNITLDVGDAYIRIDYGQGYGVCYRNHGSSCAVECGGRKKILKDSKHVDRCLKDFAIILNFQTSALKKLSVYYKGAAYWKGIRYNDALKMVKSVLNSRKLLLKTKTLIMHVIDQNNILSILPYLDSDILEVVQIWDLLPTYGLPIEVKEIVKSENGGNRGKFGFVRNDFLID